MLHEVCMHEVARVALLASCSHSCGLIRLVPLVMMMVWATPTAVLVHSLATMPQVRLAGCCLWRMR